MTAVTGVRAPKCWGSPCPAPPGTGKFTFASCLCERQDWRFISPHWGLADMVGDMGAKLAVLAALAFALGGCSYVRGYVADRDMGGVVKFCEKKRTNPAVASLIGKLPIVNVDEITPEMLALDAKPTAEEVEAIRALSRDQRECRDRIDMVAKDHWPTQSAMRKELALKLDLVTAELLKQSLTYGNANRLYQEAALDAEDRLTEDRKEQLAQARKQESEAWRTIGDGIRAIAGTQKPEPSGDPCTWVENSVDCSAR